MPLCLVSAVSIISDSRGVASGKADTSKWVLDRTLGLPRAPTASKRGAFATHRGQFWLHLASECWCPIAVCYRELVASQRGTEVNRLFRAESSTARFPFSLRLPPKHVIVIPRPPMSDQPSDEKELVGASEAAPHDTEESKRRSRDNQARSSWLRLALHFVLGAAVGGIATTVSGDIPGIGSRTRQSLTILGWLAAIGLALLPVPGNRFFDALRRWLRIGLLLAAVAAVALAVVEIARVDLRLVDRPQVFGWLLGALVVIGGVLFLAARIGAGDRASELPRHAFPVKEPYEKWFELLKLEYEKGADRYENIYRAIWQNFSYAVAVGAALLTFAATKLRIDFLQFVALSPVVFWFVATFIPMNRYGELTRARLRQIEREINLVFFNAEDARRHGLGFRHFTSFASARSLWRVGDVVHFTGALVGLYWLWLLSSVVANHKKEGDPLVLPAPPQIIAPSAAASGTVQAPHAQSPSPLVTATAPPRHVVP